MKHVSLVDNFFLKLLNNWFETPESIYEMMTDWILQFRVPIIPVYILAYRPLLIQPHLCPRLPPHLQISVTLLRDYAKIIAPVM
mgnify:CR=1 FL=1